jgi:hypothetical protein
MWTEAVVAQFKVISRHLTAGTEENHDKLRIAGLRAEIGTRDLPNSNTKEDC